MFKSAKFNLNKSPRSSPSLTSSTEPAIAVSDTLHRGCDYGKGEGGGGGGRRGSEVADLHPGELGLAHGRAQAAATKVLQDGSHSQQERVHVVQDFQGERVWIDLVIYNEFYLT